MKNYIYVLGISLMLILSLVGCSDKSNLPVEPIDQDQVTLEKKIIREFTGEAFPIEVTNPGTTKEVNGKTIIKGMHHNIVFNAVFADGGTDLLSGQGDLELNAIIDFAAGKGYWWGKLKLIPAAPEALGGHWELIWYGNATLGSNGWTLPLKELGHGKGGALKGLHTFFDHLVTAPVDLSSWHGEIKGYVRSHYGH